EYLMEVGELGCYLFVACVVATLLQHPASIVRQSIASDVARRALMGLAMGTTAIAIVVSPWGKRSGGHFNPAITLTFYRLGKVEFWDAWFYVIAQFLGAVSGVAVATYILRGTLAHHAVRYAGHGAWYVWQRRRVRCRIDDLLHPDEHYFVHYKSRKAGIVHR